jgi:hypothetical protein
MSRRDDAIVAWHEVPGRASPQKDPSRRARCDSCRCTHKSIENVFGLTWGGIAKQNGTIPKCLGSVSDHLHLCLALKGLERVRIAVQRFGADLAEPSGPFKANSDGENYPGLAE